MQFASSFLWGMESVHVTDYLIGVGQKIPVWLMKMRFLGDVETAVTSGIKSSYGMKGFLPE